MIKKTNRFVLREQTSDVHARLENVVGEITNGETYIRYLKGMMTFRQMIERELASATASETIDCWRLGEIAPFLRQDLDDLGQFTSETALSFDMPHDRPGLLGVIYVLEGSGLGARVLTRRAETLGYSSSFGARHLARQTSRADQWKLLLLLLDEIAASDFHRTVRAARMTFEVAIDCLKAHSNLS